MTLETPPEPTEVAACDYCHSDSFEIEAHGHRFVFHPDGARRFEAIIRHIDEAQETLDVFYFKK